MNINLRSTLLLFYGSPTTDCYVCLLEDNSIPSMIVHTNITTEELAKNLFQSITGIDKNWLNLKIAQANSVEYEEDGNRVVAINYIILLQGCQVLSKGYKWVKLRDLAKLSILPEEEIQNLIDAVSRRF